MSEKTYFSGFPKVLTAFCGRCGKKRPEYRVYITVATMSLFADNFLRQKVVAASRDHDNNSYKPNIAI